MGFDGGGLRMSFDINSGRLGVGFLLSLILDFYFYLVLLLVVGALVVVVTVVWVVVF